MLGMSDQVRVNRIIIVKTGTYNQIMQRPYAMNFSDGGLFNEVNNRLDPRMAYTPNLFSGISTQIIAPSAAPVAAVGIANGWETPRLRFFMELEWLTGTGSRIVQILTGYTENADVSYNNLIDPRMLFYVNNTFNFRLDIQNTPNGPIRRLVPTSGGQILIDNNYQGIYSNHLNSLARPSDVLQVKAIQQHLDGLGASGVHIGGSVITDDSKLSRRSNANPATYMASILDGHRRSQIELQTYGQSEEDIDAQAISTVKEDTVVSDRFLHAIKNINNSVSTGNYFTLNDLDNIDPNHRNVTMTFFNTSSTQSNLNAPVRVEHYAGQTEHWQGSSRHTQVATILANAVPGILTDNTLSRCSFIASNFEGGGRFTFAWTDAKGFINDIDLTGFIMNAQARIESELLVDLSYNNEISFGIECHCDILGDTRLKITIGGDMYEYVTPTFCDALYTPVIVNGLENVRQLATGFESIMNNAYGKAEAIYPGDVQNLPSSPTGHDPLTYL